VNLGLKLIQFFRTTFFMCALFNFCSFHFLLHIFFRRVGELRERCSAVWQCVSVCERARACKASGGVACVAGEQNVQSFTHADRQTYSQLSSSPTHLTTRCPLSFRCVVADC